MSDGPVIGLALGSGGARGLAHAGVLAALELAGLRPSIIVGSSMGAVVGGLYAETGDAAETWRRLVVFTENPEFLETWTHFIAKGSGEPDEDPGFLQGLYDAAARKYLALKTLTRPTLTGASPLRTPLEQMFRARDFAELKLPFAAVAVDLISGHRVLYREGDLIDAIYASATIPGVFPPVRTDGRFIVDGGVLFRVPIRTCRELGADFVIAVDLPAFEPNRTDWKTGLEIMMRADTLAKKRLNDYVLQEADLVITPEVSAYHWADFRRAQDCYDRGFEAGQAAAPALRNALAGERIGWMNRLRRLFGGSAA